MLSFFQTSVNCRHKRGNWRYLSKQYRHYNATLKPASYGSAGPNYELVFCKLIGTKNWRDAIILLVILALILGTYALIRVLLTVISCVRLVRSSLNGTRCVPLLLMIASSCLYFALRTNDFVGSKEEVLHRIWGVQSEGRTNLTRSRRNQQSRVQFGPSNQSRRDQTASRAASYLFTDLSKPIVYTLSVGSPAKNLFCCSTILYQSCSWVEELFVIILH